MKRPRLFLILIVVLLLINAVFFTAWYGFGLKDKLKGYVEELGGKALGGKLRIKSYTLGDRQVYAEGLSFASADSSMSFTVDNLRVRYNLFKFIFSGFKIKHLLENIEVNSPQVRLLIRPSEKEKKPPRKFELPDLSGYFKHLELNKGRLDLDLGIALSLGGGDLLVIRESLSDIHIQADNDRKTKLKLKAISGMGGRINLEGTLARGRLEYADGQVISFVPSYIHHPALGYPSSEINLELSAEQATKKSPIEFQAKALLWNTKAELLETYPVSLPFVSAELNNSSLNVALSTASIGSSRMGGQISLSNPLTKPALDPSAINLRLDLGMIDQSLSGFVSASVQAQGSIAKPIASFNASSDGIKVAGQQISAIRLKGSYQDELLSFENLEAEWMQHQIKAQGSLDPLALALKAKLQGSPLSANQNLAINLDGDLELALYESLPEVKATFRELSLRRGKVIVKDMSGYLNLFPATLNQVQSYYVDTELSSPDGQHLSAVGDLLDRSLAVNANFNSIALADVYPHEMVLKYAPLVRGSINGFMHGDGIVAQTDLYLALQGELELNTRLKGTGTYDLGNSNASLFMDSQGSLNGADLALDLAATLQDNLLKISSLRLNDQIYASGTLPLENLSAGSISLAINDLSTQAVTQYFPELDLPLPQIERLMFNGNYNLEGDGIAVGSLSVGSVQMAGINPISANLELRGPPGNLAINGKARAGSKELASLEAVMDLSKGFSIDAGLLVNELRVTDVLPELPVEMALSGRLSLGYGTAASAHPGLMIGAKVRAPKVLIPDTLELQDLWLEAVQTENLLRVDSLYVGSPGLARLTASGALDYNLITQRFFEGGNRLTIKADGELFNWLNKKVAMVLDAGGRSYLSCEIGTRDDQFMITKGNLDVRSGYLQLKDQIEPITAINLAASITDNRVSIDRGSLMMGGGRLRIRTEFEEDNSNHFFVGFLDLGIFKLDIEEPGILASIPFFTAPRTLTNVVMKGRDTPFFTILGPFDDMKIKGDIFLSEGQALYPPNTDNLLSLVYSFRGALSKQESAVSSEEPVPLPFQLDLMIHLRDNIRYVTYPANLDIQPGGLLHLVYDGQTWSAKEANFSSERGTIDFLGTVFQAEYLNINILESQNLFIIDGSFFKRGPDGTIITLRISTDRDNSKPLMERLEFNLSSDNPSDRSITDILARMRYSQPSNELSGSQQQILLQDEALGLISDNLNASLLSPMIYPFENQIRRLLKLDSFSINAGFIQNLFTQYSNDPNQLAEYVDTQHLMDDITQFSSTILLNNLSVSASKYLGRKLFLDYTLSLQEATDLQQRTRILVSHDTSLRLFLPEQFKLGYTFKYEPQDERLSHELMLERSFRFWGL